MLRKYIVRFNLIEWKYTSEIEDKYHKNAAYSYLCFVYFHYVILLRYILQFIIFYDIHVAFYHLLYFPSSF